MSRTLLNVLQDKKFLPLFICQFLSSFSENYIRTAFVSLVTFYYSLLHFSLNANILIMMALASFMLPFCILSAVGGQLSDKFNKGKVAQWVKLCNIPISLIIIVGFVTGNAVMILLGLLLLGCQASIFGACKYSMLPVLFAGEDLVIVNALVEGSTFVAVLLGIMLGGSFNAASPMHMFTTCVLFLACSVCSYISSLFIQSASDSESDISIDWNLYRSTKDVIAFARSHEFIFLTILGISWFWMYGGIFTAHLPQITKTVLGGNESVFILILASFSVGITVGSVLITKLLRDPATIHYVPLSILLSSIFSLDFWLVIMHSHSIGPKELNGIHYFLSQTGGIRILIDAAFMGVFGGMYIVPLYSCIQVKAPVLYRGRIIAANNAINSIFMVGASLFSSVLLYIGLPVTILFFMLVAMNFVATGYICRILPDSMLRNILRILIRCVCTVEVVGIENYEKAGNRVLIVANHVSFLDPFIIGIFIPDPLIFAIDSNIAKNWWIRPFLKILRAYPIDSTNPMVMKTLIDKLKSDKRVVIFPEGRITVTGSLMKIYEGPGLVAEKSGALLLPIRLDGPEFSLFSRMRGKLRLSIMPNIRMTIMPPCKIEVTDNNLKSREKRHVIGDKLYDIMSHMMFSKALNSLTVFEAVLQSIEQFGGRHIIANDASKQPITYNKLLMGCIILGEKIKRATKEREYIGLLLPNAVATVITMLSIMANNRVPVMLNFGNGPATVLNACQTATIRNVYTSRMFIEKGNLFEMIRLLVEAGINIIYLEDLKTSVKLLDKIKAIPHFLSPKRWYRKNMGLNDNASNSAAIVNSPAVVLFTSGSEGVPKGVVLTHGNILSNAKQIASRVDFTATDIVFNALPMFHSFGLTAGTILPIVSGVRVVLYPSPLHYRVIPEMAYGCNATIFFGTDTFLSGYAKYAHPYDFFSVRYVFAGAEKVRQSTRDTWMDRFGIRILEGYGATEAAPVISVNTPMYYRRGTVGRLMPAMQYRIVPVEGIEHGGLLLIHGPNIMLGYMKHDKPGVIRPTSCIVDGVETQGWYDTGDIVEIDESGYITIVGRSKRFAKIAGEMVSMPMLEDLISKLWPSYENAVICIPDRSKGEALALCTTNPHANRSDILEFFHINGYNELLAPKYIIKMDEIPTLATGKIDYVSIIKHALSLHSEQEES